VSHSDEALAPAAGGEAPTTVVEATELEFCTKTLLLSEMEWIEKPFWASGMEKGNGATEWLRDNGSRERTPPWWVKRCGGSAARPLCPCSRCG
jgi:hypothetical protein